VVSAVTAYHEGTKNHEDHEDFQYKESFVFFVILRGFVKNRAHDAQRLDSRYLPGPRVELVPSSIHPVQQVLKLGDPRQCPRDGLGGLAVELLVGDGGIQLALLGLEDLDARRQIGKLPPLLVGQLLFRRGRG